MIRARSVFTLVTLLALALAAPHAGAQFWVKKDAGKWSSNDCKEMLSHSPWASEYKIAKVVMETIGATPTGGDPSVEGREQPHVTYRAVFLSAKPVRQAMMRMEQLTPRYARMEPVEQKAFEQRADGFINGDFSDKVVIQLNYFTVQAYSLPLARYWQSVPEAELRKMFMLVTPAGKIEAEQVLTQFGGQGGVGQFQLVYPRKKNGELIATKDTAQITLEFQHPAIDPSAAVGQAPGSASGSTTRRGTSTAPDSVLPSERVVIPFKTKGMVVNNELIF